MARKKSHLAVAFVCLFAGFMMASSRVISGGNDLRPARNTDLVSLVNSRAEQAKRLQLEARELRAQVDNLTQKSGSQVDAEAINEAEMFAMLPAMKGPGVKVVLDDAPTRVQPEGVDDELLIVHQQDIQAVVNVLWANGAEAMMIQGQRVISTTSIKCVGNTVVLHGIPYAPPYEIIAVGDADRMIAGLDSSEEIETYKQYSASYELGYSQEKLSEVTVEAYQGSLDLQYAKSP